MAIPSNMPQQSGNGTSNYMRFESGENKFRVLGEGISGWLVWLTVDGQRKPVRVRPTETPPPPEGDEKVKIFLTLPVWNYATNKVQILEVTQTSIRNALQDFENEEDYGDLTGYDIKVVRKGEKLDTEYTVMPLAKKAVDKTIKEAWEDTHLNLDALYDGGNPFEGGPDF